VNQTSYPKNVVLKKDGTPDMRYKVNKSLYGVKQFENI
jgi:hypothetical protein